MDSGLPDRLGLLEMRIPDARSVDWTPLPVGTACCKVAVLPAGELSCQRSLILRSAEADAQLIMPDASFVIEHDGERIIFDLGIKLPCSAYPPAVRSTLSKWNPKVDALLTDKLKARGIDPSTVKRVIISQYACRFFVLADALQQALGPHWQLRGATGVDAAHRRSRHQGGRAAWLPGRRGRDGAGDGLSRGTDARAEPRVGRLEQGRRGPGSRPLRRSEPVRPRSARRPSSYSSLC